MARRSCCGWPVRCSGWHNTLQEEAGPWETYWELLSHPHSERLGEGEPICCVCMHMFYFGNITLLPSQRGQCMRNETSMKMQMFTSISRLTGVP